MQSPPERLAIGLVNLRTAKASIRIVLKGYADGSITEQELRDYMSGRYYPQTDIDLSEKAYRTGNSVRIPEPPAG